MAKQMDRVQTIARPSQSLRASRRGRSEFKRGGYVTFSQFHDELESQKAQKRNSQDGLVVISGASQLFEPKEANPFRGDVKRLEPRGLAANW